ncbi:MAG TPA: hypothetical protein VJY62_00675 [Bacteroidia bacterium]|nr:hypothetical protein [Bacteroidia bacterium]
MRSFTYRILPFLAFMAFIQCGYAQPAMQDTTARITFSIILKFSGKNGMPEQMEVFSQNTFKEKRGFLQRGQQSGTEIYKLQFFTATGELLYSEEIQNPLKEVMEKNNLEGFIERKEVVKETGYVNIRFEINENVKKIKAVCSKINGEEEIPVTSVITDIE